MTTFALGPYTVGRVGFGAMQLPGPGVFGPPRDKDQALAVLRRAVAAGVNHIDTAQFYGPDVANALIREALHPYPKDLAIVSKVGARRDETGAWLPAQKPGQLRKDLEKNLKSLGVDKIAAVNLRVHSEDSAPNEVGVVDREKFIPQVEALVAAREEGLIDGVGLSNVSVEHLRCALELTEVVCVQNAYNLVDRTSQPVLDLCIDHDIAFVPFFPLGSAFAADNPVLGNSLIRRTAEELDKTPAQIALAWTLSVAPNVLLIPGTSSLKHLEENLAVADIKLPGKVRKKLNGVD